ncbi:YgdI/YgdR family lipoprotein [Undibacterium sp. TS12]|uniref:YgdI/YgdR family lipoprotein n=1 Tax=Undibacterium sp. TS12 TaxID=2908202 RepID=UPI001F4CBBD7|nr:YgdI/YgdR family lipoprotein [Undibacterium sp. TS12]MCH8622787.1 YgdI/YgdR family lipoprotein [Undibacterium sp. TS12]
MKELRILLTILVLFTLSACEGSWSSPRYQLVTASDGKVYRIDSQSGTVHYVTAEKMQALNDGLPTLHVGEYYQMADADGNSKYLKYLGNAQFEKSPATTQKQ